MRTKEEYLFDEFLIHEDFFVEMSNRRKNETGLPMNIWISMEPYVRHGPRVKIQMDYLDKINKDNFCSVSISDNPKAVAGEWKLTSKDFELVCRFISSHKEMLLRSWNVQESYYEKDYSNYLTESKIFIN